MALASATTTTTRAKRRTSPCKDSTIMMAPNGYHTVVSAPGYTTYYLWFLAGEHRVQATQDDPALGWVSKTVPMLKELGH